MIHKQKIEDLIKEKLEEGNFFMVALEVTEENKILLEIDGQKGFSVKDCITFSKMIEQNLDREVEDFELKVSSPGLDKPLRVKEQYVKNIGKNVKVVLLDGEVVKGELIAMNEDEITIEYSYKERIEGRKKKQLITKQEKINNNNIKETTVIISFK